MAVATQFLLFAAAAQAAVRSAPTPPASESSSVTAPDDEMRMRLSGVDPSYPFDPNTSSECTWWYDNDGDVPCADMPDWAFITPEEWHYWNPSIGASCNNFIVRRSYCIAAFDDLPPPPPTTTTAPGVTTTRTTTTTRPPTTTTTAPPTTTTAGNGISTPQPIQPGMVPDCDAFHEVRSGENCLSITQRYGISMTQFTTWNPLIGGSSCTGLWLGAYVCVSIIGHTPPATTTRPSNGISTPQPIQEGLVDNCDRFHLVKSGEKCATVAGQYGITVQQFQTWNPSVGAGCTRLLAEYHVCVRTIGFQPPATTTTRATTTMTTRTGNGISTPQPTQTNMANNCDRFHYVQPGQTCAIIGARNGVTAARISQWNGLSSSCSGLWADTYACVRTIGYTSTSSASCASSGKTWGDNRAAALNSVILWCNGDSSTDGSGGFATAQTKRGCYNAPSGTNKIQFTARNDFGTGTSLPIALCNQIMRVPIDRCDRGGTGTHEGWWFSAVIVEGRC